MIYTDGVTEGYVDEDKELDAENISAPPPQKVWIRSENRGSRDLIFAGVFPGILLGFGAALLIVPVLSAILTPEKALVIVFLIELPTVIYLMPGAFRQGDPKTVMPIILAMFFTIPIGVYFLVSTDPNIIKIVISIIYENLRLFYVF